MNSMLGYNYLLKLGTNTKAIPLNLELYASATITLGIKYSQYVNVL